MRDWKKNDKFTAQDYVNERDGITSEIETLDIQLQEIRGDKLILSDRPPDVDYDDYLWMDPQELAFFYERIDSTDLNYESSMTSAGFLRKSSVLCDVCLDYSSDIVGKYFQREYGELQDAALSYDSTTESHKMPQFEAEFIANIVYDSQVISHKMPQLKSDFDAALTYNSTTTSHKMPQFESNFDFSLEYNSDIDGYPRPKAFSDFDAQLNYTSGITSSTFLKATSDFDANVEYSSATESYKMQQLESTLEDVSIAYDSATTSTTKLLAFSDFNAELSYDSSTTSTVVLNASSDFNTEINYESATTSTIKLFASSDFSGQLNYDSATTSTIKLTAQSQMTNATIGYDSSLEGNVSYSVYARNTAGPSLQMTVQFTGESSYSTTVSGISDTLIRSGITTPIDIGITTPQSFAQGPVTYVFNRWEVNGVAVTPSDNTLITTIDKTKYLVAYYDEFI